MTSCIEWRLLQKAICKSSKFKHALCDIACSSGQAWYGQDPTWIRSYSRKVAWGSPSFSFQHDSTYIKLPPCQDFRGLDTCQKSARIFDNCSPFREQSYGDYHLKQDKNKKSYVIPKTSGVDLPYQSLIKTADGADQTNGAEEVDDGPSFMQGALAKSTWIGHFVHPRPPFSMQGKGTSNQNKPADDRNTWFSGGGMHHKMGEESSVSLSSRCP